MAFQQIIPCFWFDNQAEEAARFYTGIFKNSKVTQISHYGEAGQEVHGQKPGSVMVVAFELDGQSFTALNGGPVFKFNEAISFQVQCDTQDEIDFYWGKLSAGGDPKAQQCGWLKDKYGASWQIVPRTMGEMMTASDPAKSNRVMTAMLLMKKIDLAALKQAFDGLHGASVQPSIYATQGDAMDASLLRDKRVRALKVAKQPSIRKANPTYQGGSSDGYGIKVPKA